MRNLLCWLCENSTSVFEKKFCIDVNSISTENFAITDKMYGHTLPLAICNSCGFIQTSVAVNPIVFYTDLIDEEYEMTRTQRLSQSNDILNKVSKFLYKKELIDIGAGSGILIEAAKLRGIQGTGIEPSEWLVKTAKNLDLNVIQGTTKDYMGKLEKSSVVTMVDVIEHVMDPKDLIIDAISFLRDDGVLIIITPNINSTAYKVLRSNWWHFRIAHVCYFSKENLILLGRSVGLEPIDTFSPSWSFPLSYLFERLAHYIFIDLNKILPKSVLSLSVKINLFDSIGICFKKA